MSDFIRIGVDGTLESAALDPTAIDYDNAGSSLVAATVSAAIDELDAAVKGSVTVHSDVSSAGSGAIITVGERNLVNSSLQPGNNISLLSNNIGYVDAEGAQDAVGVALLNTETVTFTYNDTANQISAVANPIFGQGFQQFSNAVAFNFTNAAFVDAYTFVTTSKTAGVYRIEMKYLWTPGNSNSLDSFTLRVNGVDQPFANVVEGNDVAVANRIPGHLSTYFTLAAAGTITIVLRVAQAGAGTSVIRGAQAEIWRVS